MKTKIFTKNEKGKIEFTEKELKNLLDEIYNEGYNDGKSKSYTYTTPIYTNPWWYGTYCTAGSTTDAKYTTAATTSGSSTITVKGDK